ncbi:MAG TPA: LysR substrate-binding domain-containing protein [Oscillospiraceae bacterium]|nr:LysR substrate-binding domain-containing protein [Oscillospiraceae bacterium]
MDIRVLRYISEIAKTGSLTRAASNLYISQPALSKALKKAEEDLDCQIFRRNGTTLDLTDAGEVVLAHARLIIAQYEIMGESILDIKKLKTGHTSLGIPAIVSLLFFPPMIVEFRKRYPGIDLQIYEFGGVGLADRVIKGEIDVAIGMRPILRDELSEIPIFRNEVGLSMRKEHFLAGKEKIKIRDLENVPIVTFNKDFMAHVLLMERFHEAGFEPTADFLSIQCDIMMEMARLSNTVCILPKPILEYYGHPDMKIATFEPEFTWELCMIFRKNGYLSRATKTLIAFIQNQFSNIQNGPYGPPYQWWIPAPAELAGTKPASLRHRDKEKEPK